MKVYTKTGDNGTTSLIGGRRVSKSDIRLEIYGTLDELSSFLGMLKCNTIPDDDIRNISKIQEILTKINMLYASPDEATVAKFQFDTKDILWMEAEIDRISVTLPPVTDFLIPGTNRANALANICRTICRRAERNVYKMQLFEIQQKAAVFLNRLSDYLFVLGRKLE
ncbi:MAG: cob(I)yrinic acid a,c-diamide adenosyltransferase [Paludibacteraceae bacterium]|nr:cob(I)yrinic acid a,c-diamide adenosyltransferase [Paludibacteraceae bacterium]